MTPPVAASVVEGYATPAMSDGTDEVVMVSEALIVIVKFAVLVLP